MTKNRFSPFERLAVVTILLLVAAITIQNVLHELKASEQRILKDAVGEYEAAKGMYAEQHRALPPSTVRMNGYGAVIP